MPANLTAKYHKAEAAFRRASTPEEELNGLEAMIRELPKHKGTEKLQADLKQKVSKAKLAVQNQTSAGKAAHRIKIPRQGAGTVIILGGPNAGKSELVSSLTSASPEVAPYPFTTREPSPAMMPWEDIMIQLIDTPPITSDYLESYMQGLIRGADVAMLVVDLGSDEGIEQCQEVLERLACTKTRLGSTSYLDDEDIGRSYTKTLLVANKLDDEEAAARLELFHELLPLEFAEYLVSASAGTGLEELRQAIFEAMDVIRIYTKAPKAKEPDYDKPFTIRSGGTLIDVAGLVHKDVAENFKFARVWGEGLHDGTSVTGDYVLHDRDVVEIHVT